MSHQPQINDKTLKQTNRYNMILDPKSMMNLKVK